MGNLVGFTKKGKVSVRHVWNALQEVLNEHFPGVFHTTPLLGKGIRIQCKDCPDLQWEWWQDGNRVWGKYPRYGEVGYWVHTLLLDEIGTRIGCRLVSESERAGYDPRSGRAGTFRDHFERTHGYLATEEKAEPLKVIWLDAVTQIPPSLLPFAGDTGPL